MQMKSSFRDADANGDSIITLDELTAKLGNYSQPRRSASPATASAPASATVASSGASPSTGGSTRSGSSRSGGDSSSANPKKSSRFLSPQERLPRGLPDWYLRKDANADGQVSMSEYARSGWSDALADEFLKHDLNGDGVVTPEECLKASNSK